MTRCPDSQPPVHASESEHVTLMDLSAWAAAGRGIRREMVHCIRSAKARGLRPAVAELEQPLTNR